MTDRIGCCIALLVFVIAPAAAQDQVPSPPKQEIVTIRALDGAFELKGTSSADSFEFTQQCDSKQGVGSIATLTVPLEIEGGQNDSLEQTTLVLRNAVRKGLVMVVEPSTDMGRAPMIVWGKVLEFKGVVESLNVRYTLFLPDGKPTRATITLKMKEASRVMNKGENEEADRPGKKREPDCSPKRH
jgi:hypothetical protein